MRALVSGGGAYTGCMITLRSHLRSLAWLALTAMLALALLPGVSHALAAARGDGYDLTTICTAQGTRVIALDIGTDQTPAPQGTGTADCPYCPLGSHLPCLPQTLPQLLTIEQTWGLVAAPPLRAPRAAFSWAAAQPRAPPLAI